MGLIAISLMLFSFKSGNIQSNPKNKNDLTRHNIKGKVKSIKETTFGVTDTSSSTQQGDKKTKSFYLYNEKGFVTEMKEYLPNDSLDKKYTYSYNENGSMVENVRLSSNLSLEYKETWKFDANENMIEHSVYSNSDKKNLTLQSKTVCKYDEKNHLIQELFYGSNEKLEKSATYRYDDMGNMLEKNNYNADNVISNTAENSFYFKTDTIRDDKGNIVNLNQYKYNPDGSFIITQLLKYDKDNLVEFTKFGADLSTEYMYTYKYNDKGDEIEKSKFNMYNVLDEKTTSKYVYDKTGNWIKATISKNEVPESTKEREIVYY